MELEFVKEGTMSVATFAATSDFNLHIEKAKDGAVNFYQTSSVDGEYDLMKGLKFDYNDLVLDIDCTALVYPKYIKIIAYTDIVKAVVTYASDTQEAIDASIVSIINNPV